MRFARVRSGLAESIHDVAAIALDADGSVVFASGDVDMPFFYRSAIKPIQAAAAARTGLRLPAEHLAVTCSSHGGFPVHLAIVEQILTDHGLDTGALKTTPGLPTADRARKILAGQHRLEARSLFHNCSGKHSGWLAACTVAGWDTSTYLDERHPLQQSIIDLVRELSGVEPLPAGVDGCGAPTLRGSVRALAMAFGRLSSEPEFAPIVSAIDRFHPLVADNTRPDGILGINWTGPSKAGAEGCIALARNGVAIATKSLEGDGTIAAAAAAEVASELGLIPQPTIDHIEGVRHPEVLGAGTPVGRLELVSV